MFSKNYLGHDFKDVGVGEKTSWFICDKCKIVVFYNYNNITYRNNEIFFFPIGFLNNFNNSPIAEVTCNEYIIKIIIE